MTLLGLIVDISYQVKYTPQLERIQQRQKNQLATYLVEKRYFSEHPLFKQQTNPVRDFSSLFSQALNKEAKQELVSFQLKKEVLSSGDKWLEKRNLKSSSAKIDKIFSQVHNFDHWILTKKTLKETTVTATDFIVMTQIYLSNALYHSPDDIIISLEQTRNLSKVLLSTQILNFKLAGLSLLEKEKDLINFMIRRKISGAENWTTISQQEIKRFRNFLDSTNSFLNLITPETVLNDVFLKDDLPVGSCALYNQKKDFLAHIQVFLTPLFPFEPSFQDNIRVFDKIKATSLTSCQATPLRPLPKASYIQHIPYYRRIFAVKALLEKSETL